ncbi:unnamed protein product [Polarella glacialis]|uniref:Uncharacterized protein n=1 Tax=Polarella glacialis TaxID=89957 RepID=A0A813IUH3_POLGL|nr:unnamed protein product [Polarella glacialis]
MAASGSCVPTVTTSLRVRQSGYASGDRLEVHEAGRHSSAASPVKLSGALDLLSLGPARRPKIHGRGPATLGTCKHLLLWRASPPASAFRVDGGSRTKVTSVATPVEKGPTVNPASSNSSAAHQPAMPGLRDLPLHRLRQVALAPSRGSRLGGACSG